MKCPKCGYTSFESNDTCKKCSHDLTAHRATYGLKPIVFQTEMRAAMAAAMATETVSAVAPQQPAEQPADMFSFDIPDEKSPPPAEETPRIDPFSFDDTPASPTTPAPSPFAFDELQSPAAPPPQEDAFADLLEPTQLGGPAPSAAPATAPSPPLAGDAPGEYDLSSFSWDDTLVEPSSGTVPKKADDDFTSLFGEIDDAAAKKQS
jgi:hypothetical protein